MGEFLGSVSIAEAMGDLYGKKVRLLVAVAGTIGAVGTIAVQFKVFGSIFSYFFSFSDIIAIIVAGSIATIYSAFGGIRAVTFTDVLQFFAFGCIFPLVGFLIWNQFFNEGYSLAQAASNPKFNIKLIFSKDNKNFVEMLIVFTYFAITTTSSAPAFQRIAMGVNLAQVKRAFLIAGGVLIIIQAVTAWIPFLLYSMNPGIVPNQLLVHIVNTYSYTGLKGLLIVAVIALSMSTADSRINTASVLFTNDIYKLFKFNFENEIYISRIFSLAMGAGAIFLSLSEKDLLNIVIFSNSFYYPVVTPLFLLTVFGFRSSARSVLIGMIAGFVATIFWKYKCLNLQAFIRGF